MNPPRPPLQLFPPPDLKPHSRVLVMGVGGAGCNSVARMARTWKEGPATVAVNTDVQALSICDAPRTVLIGEKSTNGLGAGNDVQVGRFAAEESIAALQELLSGVDLLILIGGMGRGTATGAMPVIAKMARELGVLTLAFVSMPFSVEGDSRRRQADEGVLQLQRYAGAVITQPNDRLSKLVKEDTPIEEAFAVSDAMLAEGIYALWHLLTRAGVMNITFADVRELAERSGGTLAFAYAEAEGPARIASALRNLLDSPLLEGGRLLSDAEGVLVNIAGGPDLTLSDMQGIMGEITQHVRPNAHISMGALVDAGRRERVTITLLATEKWGEEQTQPLPVASGAAAKSGGSESQPELPLVDKKPADKGPFGKSRPTVIDGEDLDIPTFIRRGVKLSFET